MPYKRTGTSKYWITVAGVRQTSGTDNYDDAKALEARLNHQGWLQEKMGIEPPHSWREAVVKFLGERAHKVSYDTMKQRLLWWHPYLGDVQDLTRIKRDYIDQTLQKQEVNAEP